MDSPRRPVVPGPHDGLEGLGPRAAASVSLARWYAVETARRSREKEATRDNEMTDAEVDYLALGILIGHLGGVELGITLGRFYPEWAMALYGELAADDRNRCGCHGRLKTLRLAHEMIATAAKLGAE